MAKPTKNIITRDFVEKELRFQNSADIKLNLTIGVPSSLFFGAMGVFCLSTILNDYDLLLVKIILAVLLGGTFFSPLIGFSIMIGKCLIERRKIVMGEFEVSVRELSYKDERTVNRSVRRFFYFAGFKQVMVDYLMYQMASNDDEYYIVHYTDGVRIKLLYPLKLYEYKEN